MAGLSNASPNTTETPYFTFSGWIRFPGSGGSSIITFGQSPDGDIFSRQGNCGLWITDTSVNFSFLANSLFNFEGSDYYQFVDGQGNVALSVGSWHHVMLAADMSVTSSTVHGDTNTLTSRKIVKLVVDGAHVPTVSSPPVSGTPEDTFDGYPDSNSFFVDVPGWNIASRNVEMGVPDTSANLASNPAFDAADWQFWFNRFIDPTISSNFAKFVSLSGDVGTPVNPAVAAAAFGMQTLLFEGDKDHFYVNRGTAGGFSKVGTISDFTPVPSYG